MNSRPFSAQLCSAFVSSSQTGPAVERHSSGSAEDFTLEITPALRAWSESTRAQSAVNSQTAFVASTLGPADVPLPLWKRCIDLTVCLAALPLLVLGTLALAALTAVASPGPVFFQQERVGYQGRRFKLYKFRTMKVGADSSVHHEHCKALIRSNAPMVKLDHRGDARLIPLGWLLRATGLDELPQMINVLKGEMSLVGPRPCLPIEFDHYVSWQRQRCNAVPGLTGLWQVSGKNRTTFDQMIRLDIKYARRTSLCLDLKIILLTVPALLTQLKDTRRARAARAVSARALSHSTSEDVAPELPPKPATEPAAQAKPLVEDSRDESAAPPSPRAESLLHWLQDLHRKRSARESTTDVSAPPTPPA